MSEEKDLEQKAEEVGEKLQKWGCALTVLITTPIILTIFLGPIGLIISIGIIVLYFIGRNKNNEGENIKIVDDYKEVNEGEVYRFKKDNDNVMRYKRKIPDDYTRWQNIGLTGQKVAGTSYRQENCKNFINGKNKKVKVEYESTEEHPEAIKVIGVWQDEQGINRGQLGYIEKDVAQEIHNNYDNLPIKANLATIYKPTEDKNLGIRVFLLREKYPSQYKMNK